MHITLLSLTIMITARMVAYTLPILPYPTDALEPVIGKATLENHHGKHFATYVNNLNKLVPGSEYAGLLVEEIVQQQVKNSDIKMIFHMYQQVEVLH